MSVNARPTVQIDNDRVRVTEWRFAPGAATGWPRHDYDYVVVPTTTGRLRVVSGQGESTAELTAGQAYFRGAGVVVNPSEFLMLRDLNHAADVSQTAQLYRHDLIPFLLFFLGGLMPEEARRLFQS